MDDGLGGGKRDPLERDNSGVSQVESFNFSLNHRHSGIHGDGQRIPAAFIDWNSALLDGDGPILRSPNGNKYRIIVDNDGRLGTDGPL